MIKIELRNLLITSKTSKNIFNRGERGQWWHDGCLVSMMVSSQRQAMCGGALLVHQVAQGRGSRNRHIGGYVRMTMKKWRGAWLTQETRKGGLLGLFFILIHQHPTKICKLLYTPVSLYSRIRSPCLGGKTKRKKMGQLSTISGGGYSLCGPRSITAPHFYVFFFFFIFTQI